MTRDTSLLQQEQVEKLMQIGAYLHHIREDNSLSLEEVAAQTLIQARLLKAIEEGKLHQLPEPVYVQGFIKRYAEALGLDGTEFADAFPTEKMLQVAQHASWKDSPAAQLRPLHLYIAYIALIMASVSLLSYLVGRSAPSQGPVTNTQVSPNQIAVQATPKPPQTSASPGSKGEHLQASATKGLATVETVARNPLSSPSPSDKAVRVGVKLTAQSWLRIVIDGKTEFEGVLPEGTERSWQANNQLTVRAGNAGGVLLAYNSGQAAQMGAPGAVEEQTFSAGQDAASLPNSEQVAPVRQVN